MSHDWSARRSRETMNSALPQPSSSLKRTSMAAGNSFASHQHGRSLSGSRHSLAMRPDPPPFAPRPSMGPPNSGNSGLSSAPRRQSLFPQKQVSTPMGPPPSSISMTPKAVSSVDAERRTSVYRTRAPQQSFFQAVPNVTGHPRDSRPLRDRNYQAQLGQELIDYMVQYNFEQEMKHSMSPNMMKSPTQKDFNLMFQWLYKRIDPSHRFQKNIDQEVPPILKQLRYPYEKNITKSQIAAVGGQNWSTFLGLLHWMMSLARMIEGYTTHGYEEACLAAGIDLRGDRIVNNFLKAAYQEWIELPDDIPDEEASLVLDKHIEVMAEKFKRNDSQYIQELEHLEAEYAQLQQQIDDIEKDTPDPATLDKNCAIMEDDANKFRTYNSLAQGRVEKYETRIASLQAELQNVAVELQEAEEERRGLQQIVDDQGISMQDIDRMTAERERLQKGIEALGSQLDEAKKVVAERETEAARRLDELERMIREYNTMAYQIGLIPSTAANANGQNYELQIAVQDPDFTSTDMLMKGTASSASDRLLANGSTGYQPAHVLNLDLRGKIKDSFIKLQRHVAERRAESVDDMMKDHEVLDGMKEAMEEKQNEMDALEHRIRALDQEYERTKDITSTQKMSSDLQIEKLENELAKMRAGLSESVQLMEQREMNTNIEYEQLVVRANALREELHTEIDRMLNDVIKFKLHVQKNLDDYEGFVADEVEKELGSLELEFEEDPQ